MKTLIHAAAVAALVIGAGTLSEPAHAQFGDLKKMAKKKAKKEADKAKRDAEKELDRAIDTAVDEAVSTAVRSGAPVGSIAVATTTAATAAVTSASATPAGAIAAPTNLTTCSSLRPDRIVYGRMGDYTFQKGMSTETKNAFVQRRDVQMTNQCFLPDMAPRDIAYLEYDEAAFKALGDPGDFSMQCVKVNDTSHALHIKEPRGEYPSNVDYVKDANMRLACGNSEGITECTNGMNSDRASAYSDDLKARGKIAFTFDARPSVSAPAGGEPIYCQYYNETSGQSLFAFAYTRARN